MPLHAEAGVVHPLMSRLQYTDYQTDPRRARERVLQTVRLLDDGAGGWREGENPFPGLEPFTAAFSRVFFGRAAEACEVGNRVRAMGSVGTPLAVVGPLGCGKSSLLNAAVVPLVDSDPAWLTVALRLVPGPNPLPELARALATTANRVGNDQGHSSSGIFRRKHPVRACKTSVPASDDHGLILADSWPRRPQCGVLYKKATSEGSP
ncbi:MAG: hypothetical protein JO100_02815 [Pseudonocardia sp.]|nr:hypothetical protein [Pseudonocardia sp.]